MRIVFEIPHIVFSKQNAFNIHLTLNSIAIFITVSTEDSRWMVIYVYISP